MHYVICSTCGKRVSNMVGEDITVRAYVECPNCIEKIPDIDLIDIKKDLYEVFGFIKNDLMDLQDTKLTKWQKFLVERSLKRI